MEEQSSTQKHSTIDTSSTGAEIAELFHCALGIKRMRNLMQELEMEMQEPTLCYQDNQPTIKIAEGAKTTGAMSTKTMNIKLFKSARGDSGRPGVISQVAIDCRHGG